MADEPTAPKFDGTQPCAQEDPDLFFPVGNDARSAKVVCAGCRFKQPCLAYALTWSSTVGYPLIGVWGGTTDAERRRVRRQPSGTQPRGAA